MDNLEKIKNSANLCLNCKNPMCKKGCPIETNIPEFISKIKENKFEEAYIIKGIKSEPIKISELEKFVNNWAELNNIEHIIERKEENGVKVAIIGSGPAGIACATELLKEGFDVTIYEKEEKIGGLLEYGIPDFRLDKSLVQTVLSLQVIYKFA